MNEVSASAGGLRAHRRRAAASASKKRACSSRACCLSSRGGPPSLGDLEQFDRAHLYVQQLVDLLSAIRFVARVEGRELDLPSVVLRDLEHRRSDQLALVRVGRRTGDHTQQVRQSARGRSLVSSERGAPQLVENPTKLLMLTRSLLRLRLVDTGSGRGRRLGLRCGDPRRATAKEYEDQYAPSHSRMVARPHPERARSSRGSWRADGGGDTMTSCVVLGLPCCLCFPPAASHLWICVTQRSREPPSAWRSVRRGGTRSP